MRIALLSYRGKEHCGGQGVYIRHLSRALAELGHHVEVIAGPPYPVVDPGVRLTRLPGLDLYAEPHPFRTPRLSELRRIPDWVEFLGMRFGRFTEPLAFSLRARRHLTARRDEFDVIHDNQCLGYGLLGIRGTPVIATVHHPVDIDSDLKPGSRRWYSFTRMQRRVTRRLSLILTVSQASRAEITARMGVPASRIRVVPLGADPLFRPRKPVPGRIVSVTSADEPLKGLDHLLAAFARVQRQRDCELVVIGRPRRGQHKGVTFVSGLPAAEYAAIIGSAEVVCIPSLFEGFSLPAVEAMASGVPVVATTGGALPEVLGDAAVFAPPGDPMALAHVLTDVLGDAAARSRMGQMGVTRASQLSWNRTAKETVDCYHEVLGSVRTC